MDIKRNFSSNLKQLMLERGIKQYQLAQALQVSEAIVSHWLSMKREPTLSNIHKIICYFKCTYDDLVQE